MTDAGAARVLPDAELTPERLRAETDAVLAAREDMAAAARGLAKPDAARRHRRARCSRRSPRADAPRVAFRAAGAGCATALGEHTVGPRVKQLVRPAARRATRSCDWSTSVDQRASLAWRGPSLGVRKTSNAKAFTQ